ncbi:hypothetical protein BR93DRAFT_589808 [Coniochaeta sp. PMI_546]|nr:hypothetical protein BR93DRAFT_589808 [Coniochaeta sp. PMI_546]
MFRRILRNFFTYLLILAPVRARLVRPMGSNTILDLSRSTRCRDGIWGRRLSLAICANRTTIATAEETRFSCLLLAYFGRSHSRGRSSVYLRLFHATLRKQRLYTPLDQIWTGRTANTLLAGLYLFLFMI